VRIKRAINEESKALTCEYIGKGKLMPFPMRDDRTTSIQKVVDGISKMNKAEFDRFIKLVIKHLQKDDKIKDENIPKLINVIRQLRDNPELLKNYVFDWENDFIATIDEWFPGCLLLLFLYLLFGLLISLVFEIYSAIRRPTNCAFDPKCPSAYPCYTVNCQ